MFGLDWLFSNPTVMTIVGPLLLGAQIACLIHIIKTGRPYWWLWIIFIVPLVGIAAYVFLEVRPSLGKVNVRSLLWKLKSSSERIGILQDNLADSSTVRNRLALADELHAAGHFDRECEVLAEGLCGPFKDDAQLQMRLAQAHLEAGRAGEAEQIHARVVPERSSDSQLQHALLKARILGGLDRLAEAEPLFQELVAKKKSEAPRFYYAEFLSHNKRGSESRTLLVDILHQYRRGTPVWRFQERKWYYAAKRLLKTVT